MAKAKVKVEEVVEVVEVQEEVVEAPKGKTKEYDVVVPFSIDGKKHEAGSKVKLSEADVKRLGKDWVK